jgi:hypothetical protein
MAMALLDTFKEKVLDLGRTEARAKARPLLIDDETFDRSAAGLDRRGQESFVLFWLLSDGALFVVGGGPGGDHAYRIPFEALIEVSLDYDENAEMLPWYVRLSIDPEGPGQITTLQAGRDPGSPLAAPKPRDVDPEERQRLARGEILPLSGFGSLTRKFRAALQRRMQVANRELHVTGEEASLRRRAARKRSRTGTQ